MPISPEFGSRLDPDSYQEIAAQTAYYERFADPMMVLEQGLADEVVEMLEQACGDVYWTEEEDVRENQLPPEDLKSELGDLLWYASQLLRVEGMRFSDLINHDQWTGKAIPASTKYVDVVTQDPNAKYPHTHVKYDFATEPVICLALQMSELIDARFTDSSERVNEALSSMLKGVTLVANLRGFTLEELAMSNVAKLATRTRKPHTINHIEDSLPSLAHQKMSLWLRTQRNKE